MSFPPQHGSVARRARALAEDFPALGIVQQLPVACLRWLWWWYWRLRHGRGRCTFAHACSVKRMPCICDTYVHVVVVVVGVFGQVGRGNYAAGGEAAMHACLQALPRSLAWRVVTLGRVAAGPRPQLAAWLPRNAKSIAQMRGRVQVRGR